MRRLFKDCRGLAFVDVMIAAVIVGILVAVALPIYQSQVERAVVAEAETVLDNIRAALQTYYFQNMAYPISPEFRPVVDIGIDIKRSDLDGKYSGDLEYTYKSLDGSTYELKATGNEKHPGIKLIMQPDGTLDSI